MKEEVWSTVIETYHPDDALELPDWHEPPRTERSRPDLADAYPLLATTGRRIPVYFHSGAPPAALVPRAVAGAPHGDQPRRRRAPRHRAGRLGAGSRRSSGRFARRPICTTASRRGRGEPRAPVVVSRKSRSRVAGSNFSAVNQLISPRRWRPALRLVEFAGIHGERLQGHRGEQPLWQPVPLLWRTERRSFTMPPMPRLEGVASSSMNGRSEYMTQLWNCDGSQPMRRLPGVHRWRCKVVNDVPIGQLLEQDLADSAQPEGRRRRGRIRSTSTSSPCSASTAPTRSA